MKTKEESWQDQIVRTHKGSVDAFSNLRSSYNPGIDQNFFELIVREETKKIKYKEKEKTKRIKISFGKSE